MNHRHNFWIVTSRTCYDRHHYSKIDSATTSSESKGDYCVQIERILSHQTTAWALVAAEPPHAVFDINALFTQLFGLTREFSVGKDFPGLIKPKRESSNHWLVLLSGAAAGRRSRARLNAVDSAGRIVTVAISCLLISSRRLEDYIDTQQRNLVVALLTLSSRKAPLGIVTCSRLESQAMGKPTQDCRCSLFIQDHLLRGEDPGKPILDYDGEDGRQSATR